MDGIVLIAQLVVTCGSIEGRKKFQKIVHILQSTGHPFREDFGYLHYGPYSPLLRAEIEHLERLGLIEEQATQTPFAGYSQFSYRPTQRLDSELRQIGHGSAPEWSATARELNALDTPLLEAMSTILFLRKCGFESPALKDRFSALKPGLVDQFAEATQRVSSLRLAG